MKKHKALIALLIVINIFAIYSYALMEENTYVAVKSLKVEESNISLLIGASDELAQKKINVTLYPEEATQKECVFVSNNESVATVDSAGVVHAISAGKAKITVSSADKKNKAKAICNITVGEAVKGIEIPSSLAIYKGKSVSLKPSITPDKASKKVEYVSSDTSVATVSKAGVVKGIKCGNCSITCTALDGSGIASTCNITVVQPVNKVSTTKKKIVMFKGQKINWPITVGPNDATNKRLNYSSSSSSVSVDDSGTITAKYTGKAKVTASSTDGSKKTCTCDVLVEPSVPLSVESIGNGIFIRNLFGITVTNQCSTKTIVDFEFELRFYSASGSLIDGGSYSLGKQEKIGPGKQKTIKRNVYGSGQAYKTVITVTAVRFSDGEYWSIPSSEQITNTFTRR